MFECLWTGREVPGGVCLWNTDRPTHPSSHAPTPQLLHQRANLDIFLGHDPCEHPVAVQLGGFDPKDVGGASGVCGLFGACFKFIYILISMITIIIMIDFF